MHKLSLFILIAGLPVLSACGQQKKDAVAVQSASPQEAASAVAASGAEIKLHPGTWEKTIKISKMDMPGLPPEMAAKMQARMGMARVYSDCLTKEQADRPTADFFQKDSKDCTFDHLTMGGGKIDMKMTCKVAQGGTTTMTASGTYDADSMALTSSVEAEQAAGAPRFASTTQITAHRVSDACAAK